MTRHSAIAEHETVRLLEQAGLRRVSASQIKLYRECRYRYYRQYVLGERELVHISAALGTAVHGAIERYYTDRAEPEATFSALFSSLLANQEVRGYTEERAYQLHAEGLAMVRSFPFHRYQPRCEGIEQFFVYPFSPRTFIVGFMDLVTVEGDVIDFKTAKAKPETIDTDPQFAVYYEAYQRLYGNAPRSVQWHHVRDHSLVPVRSIDALLATLAEAKAIAERIVDDPFDDVARCVDCVYYCPFRA